MKTNKRLRHCNEILFPGMKLLRPKKQRFIVFGILITLLYFLIKYLDQDDPCTNLKIEKVNDDNQLLHGIFKHRLDRLKELCTYSLSKAATSLQSGTILHSRNLFWLPKSRIVYCPVFKAASSTWLTKLLYLSGASQAVIKEAMKIHSEGGASPLQRIEYVGATRPLEKDWCEYVTSNHTRNLVSFMVVRHPFERLVSAYRDKLEKLALPFYEAYGKEIVKKYREKAISVFGADFYDESNNYGTLLKVANGGRPNASLPTFWEFVQCVQENLCLNEHWMPIYKYCSVCHPIQLHTNPYILKFELLNDEESEFLKDVGWNEKINISIRLNENRVGKLSSADITRLYFSILSKDDILMLYEIYKHDFILFEYTFKIGQITLP